MAVRLLLVKFMRSPVVCLALHQVLANLGVQYAGRSSCSEDTSRSETLGRWHRAPVLGVRQAGVLCCLRL